MNKLITGTMALLCVFAFSLETQAAVSGKGLGRSIKEGTTTGKKTNTDNINKAQGKVKSPSKQIELLEAAKEWSQSIVFSVKLLNEAHFPKAKNHKIFAENIREILTNNANAVEKVSKKIVNSLRDAVNQVANNPLTPSNMLAKPIQLAKDLNQAVKDKFRRDGIKDSSRENLRKERCKSI